LPRPYIEQDGSYRMALVGFSTSHENRESGDEAGC
jgi:hypothetical protein